MEEHPAREEYSWRLREYLGTLRQRRWTILAVALLVFVVALAFTLHQPSRYGSQAKVLVEAVALSGSGAATPPSMETEKEVVQSVSVAQIARGKLHLTESPEDLLKGLSVSAVTDSQILVIRYDAPTAREAQQRAEAFAVAYLDLRRGRFTHDLLALSQPLVSQIKTLNDMLLQVSKQVAQSKNPVEAATLQARAASLVTQIAALQQRLSEIPPTQNLSVGQIADPANLPTATANRGLLLNGALGVFLGLVAGIGVALLRERVDERIRSEGELERLVGVPNLGVIPQASSKAAVSTRFLHEVAKYGSLAEAFWSIRASISTAAARAGAKLILITSPEAGDGKTMVTANLGAAFARTTRTGLHAIIVSADVLRPRLDVFADGPTGVGLTDVLQDAVPIERALRPATGVDNLLVMTAGQPPKNRVETFGSERMANLLHQLSEKADVVLVDSPPVLGTSDAIVLAGLVDAVVLVVDARKSTRDSILRARRALDLVDASLLGTIVNGYDPSRFRPAYYMAGYNLESSRPPEQHAQDTHAIRAGEPRTPRVISGTPADN